MANAIPVSIQKEAPAEMAVAETYTVAPVVVDAVAPSQAVVPEPKSITQHVSGATIIDH